MQSTDHCQEVHHVFPIEINGNKENKVSKDEGWHPAIQMNLKENGYETKGLEITATKTKVDKSNVIPLCKPPQMKSILDQEMILGFSGRASCLARRWSWVQYVAK